MKAAPEHTHEAFPPAHAPGPRALRVIPAGRAKDTGPVSGMCAARQKRDEAGIVEERLELDVFAHALQIVDFKSPGVQLNALANVSVHFLKGQRIADPWPELEKAFPREAVEEMREHYAGVLV